MANKTDSSAALASFFANGGKVTRVDAADKLKVTVSARQGYQLVRPYMGPTLVRSAAAVDAAECVAAPMPEKPKAFASNLDYSRAWAARKTGTR